MSTTQLEESFKTNQLYFLRCVVMEVNWVGVIGNILKLKVLQVIKLGANFSPSFFRAGLTLQELITISYIL